MVAHPEIDATVPANLMTLRSAHVELAKAVGRGQPTLRDPAGHVLALNPASATPLLAAQGHNVGLNFRDDTLHVTDETGQTPRNLNVALLAATTLGPPPGATDPMKVYGEIGDPGQTWNAYATLHGDSNGTHNGDTRNGTHYGDHQGNTFGQLSGDSWGRHHGEVGAPGELHTTYGDSHGTHFGETGVPGQGWYSYITCRGPVGVPGENWNMYGTVIAPSERALKADITELIDAGSVVDAIPVYRWRWGAEAPGGSDEDEHAGVMVDDLDSYAPWLVRHPQAPLAGPRGYNDRDLIGVLWGALRDERARTAALEARVSALEKTRP